MGRAAPCGVSKLILAIYDAARSQAAPGLHLYGRRERREVHSERQGGRGEHPLVVDAPDPRPWPSCSAAGRSERRTSTSGAEQLNTAGPSTRVSGNRIVNAGSQAIFGKLEISKIVP